MTDNNLQVREFIDSLARSLRAKDIDALMTHYASDTVIFDLRPPFRIQSAASYRENFEAWFSSVEGPIDYALRDLRIVTSDDLAVCHYLGHVRSMRTNGEKADYWVRVTSSLQHLDGRWLIVHEHVSMPIDLATMQASADAEGVDS